MKGEALCFIRSALRLPVVQRDSPRTRYARTQFALVARCTTRVSIHVGASGGGRRGVWRNDGSGGDDRDGGRCGPSLAFGIDISRAELPGWLRKLKMAHLVFGITMGVFILQLIYGDAFTQLGMKANDRIASGEWYRLISAMFMHTGVTHLLVNSISLLSTAPAVESWLGSTRFALLYAFSGISGNVLSYLCSPMNGVGASGAIFGLIGALSVVLVRHRKILHQGSRSALQSLAFIVILNFAIGMRPNSFIDNYAHLGGLLGGIAYTYVAGPRLVRTRTIVGRYVLIDRPLYIEAASHLRRSWRQFRQGVVGNLKS